MCVSDSLVVLWHYWWCLETQRDVVRLPWIKKQTGETRESCISMIIILNSGVLLHPAFGGAGQPTSGHVWHSLG